MLGQCRSPGTSPYNTGSMTVVSNVGSCAAASAGESDAGMMPVTIFTFSESLPELEEIHTTNFVPDPSIAANRNNSSSGDTNGKGKNAAEALWCALRRARNIYDAVDVVLYDGLKGVSARYHRELHLQPMEIKTDTGHKRGRG